MDYRGPSPLTGRRMIGSGIQRQYKYNGTQPKSMFESDVHGPFTAPHGIPPNDIRSKKLPYKSDDYKQYDGHTIPLEIMAQIKIKDPSTGEYIRGRKGGERVTVPCTVILDRLPKRLRDAIDHYQKVKFSKKSKTASLVFDEAPKEGGVAIPAASPHLGSASSSSASLKAQAAAEKQKKKLTNKLKDQLG